MIIDVEQNYVHFIRDLILNLRRARRVYGLVPLHAVLDHLPARRCAGLRLRSQHDDAAKDAAYYRDCLDALQTYSPEAGVFLLVQRMNIVTGDRMALLEGRARELQAESSAVLGTSVHDEALYKVRLPPMLSRARSLLSFSPFTPFQPACLD